MNARPFNTSALVRINPYWQLGDDPDNIVRRDAGLTREPDGWSVETGQVRHYRDKQTGVEYSMTTYHVEADFRSKDDALDAAQGKPIITVANTAPGGGDGFLLFEIVQEPENDRAFAEWVEWGGDLSDVVGSLDALQAWCRKHKGTEAVLDVAALLTIEGAEQ